MKYVSEDDRQIAVEALNKGAILGVPTETVYGLAVKADNTEAINKLLNLKERPLGSGKVLTMMVADVDEMFKYAKMNRRMTNFARHYFPGELTMILPKSETFSHPYFDKVQTIGIRIPQHKYMLDLLRETGPLLVTSANPRGERPCFTGKEVAKRMPSVDMVVDSKAGGSIPSTIIDFTQDDPYPVRQGGLLIVRYA
ncbi:threonylcarbamoyl-AMP synthase [Candidatus Saccharibacteria bacterium]|nr:threonylcarbamoyl-AMP synthase [Candidatus Saccharibacteria bacterium]